MPHILPALQLAQLTRWAASYEFPTDAQGALNDLAAGLDVTHSVADHVFIGFLVSTAGDALVWDAICQNLASFPRELVEQAQGLIDSADSNGYWPSALLHEADAVHGMQAVYRDPKAYEEMRAKRASEGPAFAAEYDGIAAAQALQEAEWLEGIEREYAKRWGTPGLDEWWRGVQVEAKDRPRSETVMAMLDKARATATYGEVQRAMVIAALGVLVSGPEAARGVADPTTGQPFSYVSLPNGFELRSELHWKGKPVVMQFALPTP
jgi:hypothetical protein